MENIPEAINEEVDEITHESEEPRNPDSKILERSIRILNEKLEKSLSNEEETTKLLDKSVKEVKELKQKLSESAINYENKVGPNYSCIDNEVANRLD